MEDAPTQAQWKDISHDEEYQLSRYIDAYLLGLRLSLFHLLHPFGITYTARCLRLRICKVERSFEIPFRTYC